MSKSTVLLLVGVAFVLLLFGLLGPLWPFELMAAVVGGLFGIGVGVLGALFGLVVAGIVALLVGPVTVIATLFALLVAVLAVVFSVGLVALPVLLPLALIVALIWLLARRPATVSQPLLPASVNRPVA